MKNSQEEGQMQDQGEKKDHDREEKLMPDLEEKKGHDRKEEQEHALHCMFSSISKGN